MIKLRDGTIMQGGVDEEPLRSGSARLASVAPRFALLRDAGLTAPGTLFAYCTLRGPTLRDAAVAHGANGSPQVARGSSPTPPLR